MVVSNRISVDTSWAVDLTDDLQNCNYASAIVCAGKIQLAAIHDTANHAWAAVRNLDSQHALRAVTHLLLLPAAPITILIPALIPKINDTLGLSTKWCEPSPLDWKERAIKFSTEASQAITSDIGLKALAGLTALGVLGLGASFLNSSRTEDLLLDPIDDPLGRYIKYSLWVFAAGFGLKSLVQKQQPPLPPEPIIPLPAKQPGQAQQDAEQCARQALTPVSTNPPVQEQQQQTPTLSLIPDIFKSEPSFSSLEDNFWQDILFDMQMNSLDDGRKKRLTEYISTLPPRELSDLKSSLIREAGQFAMFVDSLLEEKNNNNRTQTIAAANAFFEQQLSEEYYRDICEDDGDCFYHAISHHFGCDMMDVRQALATYLHKNRADILQRATREYVLLEWTEDSIDNFIALISQKANDRDGWAEVPHAKLISWAYNVPVVVHCHLDAGPMLFDTGIDGEQLVGRPIYLFNNGVNHWDRLIRYADLMLPQPPEEL